MNRINIQYLTVLLATLLLTSCNWFSFQDTARYPLIGLFELTEITDENGNSVSLKTDTIIPPFVYREWFGYDEVNPLLTIDSLYYLESSDGIIIDKWDLVELIDYKKRKERYEYLLSNGKYIYFESHKNATFTISIQVENVSELKNDLKKGLYTSLAEKPDNW